MEKCIIEYIARVGDWYQLEQRVEFALSYSLTRNLPQDTLVKRLQSQMPHTKVMWWCLFDWVHPLVKIKYCKSS